MTGTAKWVVLGALGLSMSAGGAWLLGSTGGEPGPAKPLEAARAAGIEPPQAAEAAPTAKPACCKGRGTEHHEGDCPMKAAPRPAGASKCPYLAGQAAAAKKDTAPADKKPQPAAAYACPMHPEVTSDHADRCPKCGMFLEKRS